MPAPLKNQARFLFEVEGGSRPASCRPVQPSGGAVGAVRAGAGPRLRQPRARRRGAAASSPALLTMLGVHEDGASHATCTASCSSASQGRQDENESGCITCGVAPQAWPLLQLSPRLPDLSGHGHPQQIVAGGAQDGAGCRQHRFASRSAEGCRSAAIACSTARSDWDFVRRLLAEDGMFHCFEHTADGTCPRHWRRHPAYAAIAGRRGGACSTTRRARATATSCASFRSTQQLDARQVHGPETSTSRPRTTASRGRRAPGRATSRSTSSRAATTRRRWRERAGQAAAAGAAGAAAASARARAGVRG
jgi:hypothetical protein